MKIRVSISPAPRSHAVSQVHHHLARCFRWLFVNQEVVKLCETTRRYHLYLKIHMLCSLLPPCSLHSHGTPDVVVIHLHFVQLFLTQPPSLRVRNCPPTTWLDVMLKLSSSLKWFPSPHYVGSNPTCIAQIEANVRTTCDRKVVRIRMSIQ